MPNLVATGLDDQQYWRRELVEGEVIRIGRAPREGWAVPWDVLISREHADVELVAQGLRVRALETARNPIMYNEQMSTEFVAVPGDEFQIGRTVFQYHDAESVNSASTTFIEHTYTKRELRAIGFKNSERCLETLCEIPRLISESMGDDQFATEIVELILDALPNVAAVAVIQFDPSADYDSPEPKLMRWNSRNDQVKRFQPSRRLMARVLQRRCSAIHLWEDNSQKVSGYTMSGDLDWAFCTPIPTTQDRWCLYVSGKRKFAGVSSIESPTDLIGELRFAELTANFIGSIRKVRWLERQQSQMRQFFSPAIVEMMVSTQATTLEPYEGDISVMFCDVRGFSRKVEQSRDRLDQLLERVSHALSAMTRSILRFEGVIADFQGDASLAFWGWPNPHEGTTLSACRAAASVHRTFYLANQDPDHPLNGFQVGIAVGHGHAIAGRIGSDDQIKVGVFGPVVNLTSRLEGITKQVGAAILIDGGMADQIRDTLPPSEARIRMVARMRPKGMDDPVDVYQLLPVGVGYDSITDEQIAQYEKVTQEIIAGNWSQAHLLLKDLLPDDGPANYLRVFLAEHGSEPPTDWDGAINLQAK
jgi:adenylate cyclase